MLTDKLTLQWIYTYTSQETVHKYNAITEIFVKQLLFDIYAIYSYLHNIHNHIHIYIFNTIVDTNYVSLQYKKNDFTVRTLSLHIQEI